MKRWKIFSPVIVSVLVVASNHLPLQIWRFLRTFSIQKYITRRQFPWRRYESDLFDSGVHGGGGYMYKSGGNAIRMYRPLSRGLFFFFFFLKRVGHGNRTRISPPPPSFLPFLSLSPPPPLSFRSFFSSTCLASTGRSTRFNYAPRPLPFVLALSRDTRTSGRDLLCASLFPFCPA